MRFHRNILMSFTALLLSGTMGAAALIYANNQDNIHIDAASTSDYYASVDDTSASTLFSSLRTIINSGASIGSYDALWTSYKTTDVGDDGKIVDIYSNTTSFTPGSDQCGTYSSEGDCYNREHTIPKSWWGGAKTNQGADLFIVYPSDGKVNGMRSNYPFGEVSNATYASNNNYSLLGSSKYSVNADKVFEPNDEWKGDMARVYFYAATKWSGSNGWTSGEGATCFGNNTYVLTDYAVNLFVKWHLEDPPSDYEIARNSKVYSIQGNRNPYIDHPEYVTTIWGESEWYEGSSASAPTSLTISQSTLTLQQGESATLSVVANPSSASNSVSWKSSNESVATISTSGRVTALSDGNTTITAVSTLDSSVYATCYVTVSTEVLEVTSLTIGGTYDTIVPYGGNFDSSNITVTANYSNGTSEDVTSLASFSLIDASILGPQNLIITYGSISKTIVITVSDDPVAVNSVVLNTNSLSLRIDETAQISPSITPSYAYPIPTISYETSADSIATVSSTGLVKAVGEGEAIITVKASQNGTIKTAQCSVTVLGSVYGEKITNYANITDGKYLITCNQGYYLPAEDFSIGNSRVVNFDEANIESIDSSYAWQFTSVGSNQYSISVEKNGTTYFLNANNKNNGLLCTASNSTTWTASQGSSAIYLVASTATPRYLTNYGITNWRTYQNANTNGSSNIILYPLNSGGSSSIGGGTVSVDGVSLNINNLTIDIGDTYQLIATITPTNASNKNITYTSSNPNCVEVTDDGLLTAKTSGNATITVKTEDGSFSDTCSVIVNETITYDKSLSLDTSSFKTSYVFGETLDLANLKAIYIDENNQQHSLTGQDLTLVSGNTKMLGEVTLVFSYDSLVASTTIHVTNVGSTLDGESTTSEVTTTITGGNWSESLNTATATNYTNNEFDGVTYNLEKARNFKDGILFLSGSSGAIYNTSAMPNITKIVLTYASGGSSTSTHSVYLANDVISSEPTTSYASYSSSNGGTSVTIDVDGNYSYFRLDVTNSKNLQLSSIAITYGTSESSSLSFTKEEQAEAYANYFLDMTATNCATLTIQDEATWNSLKTEFESMPIEAQEIFKDETNVSTSAALERYQYIVNKYTSLDDFINLREQNAQLLFSDCLDFNITYFLIIFISITILSINVVILYSVKNKAKK